MSTKHTFVLDASVALSWFFKDEDNAYAAAIRDRFYLTEAFVPAIWYLEVANALLVGERAKRSTVAQSSIWTTDLMDLPILVDNEASERAFRDILSLARAQNLSVYDASYLELAMRRGLTLATLDNKLKAVASQVGVKIYRIEDF